MKYFLIFCLLWFSLKGIAQDSLVLYTLTGCSNCAYAKSILLANHIKYKEYNVDVPSNAASMLKVLKDRKYDGRILMPVILYNNRLQFPVTQTEDNFAYFSLHDVVQKLSVMETLKEWQEQSIESDRNASCGNCEFTSKIDSAYYLVSANFQSLPEAEHFIAVMHNEGYGKAFVKEWQNLYRVVIAQSTIKDSLYIPYRKIIQHYRGAYIMGLKES